MNIVQRIEQLELKSEKPDEVRGLKDRIEKLETIIESMGYYISGK